MTDLDMTTLERVTGGSPLTMEQCHWIDQDAARARKGGLMILARNYRDDAAGCREEYRAEHPGVLGAIRSWF